MFFLDLFSGAGGLSEGFISEGFTPVAHIEMDADAINTIKTRTAYHFLKNENNIQPYINYLIKQISREDFYQLLPEQFSDIIIHEILNDDTVDNVYQRIDRNMKTLGCTDLDVLIGGPPCQTYSLISRNMKKYNNTDDQRNHLYKIYAKILGKYNPKFFVFENVPGLKSIKGGEVFSELISLIRGQGYKVVSKELDASLFGPLQKRTRIIITGWRTEYNLEDIIYQPKAIDNALVSDLFKDLMPIKPGEEKNTYKGDPTDYLFNSGLRQMNGIPLTYHQSRYQNDIDRTIYKIAAKLWNEEGKRLKYSDLPPELITRSNPNTFTDKYKVVAGDLPYSHTVIAHIAKDGHYYIHPDVEQARSLSVREAARIQSFPDDYYFEGSRIKVLTQIGNAVPPLMAKQIAKGIKEALSNV